MTIAISLKVNDGLVLAADSASTLIGQDPSGGFAVLNVYNYANKILNLKKGLPIGVITWGDGNIGTASISTLLKDLRRRFDGADGHTAWEISETYTIRQVAESLRQFIFEETYVPVLQDVAQKPNISFIVAGYSSGESMAEEYRIDIVDGVCGEPEMLRAKDAAGITWGGQPDAISRLVLGIGTDMPRVLRQNLGVAEEQIDGVMHVFQQALAVPFVMPAMPIQDAIDLAEFLVDATIKFYRFMPGAQTVGGPIEIAAISKHEGFKWIRRKHYYSQALNP